ncbi:GntR family transcriptional regulator [Paraburkholderia sp. MMS20-SJTR3]|uniref:GntR family transcriptional regulator n=1 Tax=Paraburkholderia sejongensis TaxID=2886946 RepID=A0ABS8K5U2_9BURK|nr:GntR family transcriptional regulator [Paraburkholderia sp. MMS20-SJTR3]MCC8397516.1 GntR family transcriptional regulator [Paraburkholderia sp. MMS20-SJTR3]
MKEQRESADARIYRSIFEGVLNRRLTPGTKLPEPELCALFGASRAVVRRALEKLAYDGIVALRPNKGAVIAQPSHAETRSIFEARRAVERSLVELAIQRASGADLAALREQLAQEHDAMHRFDQPSWARLASGFHLRIAALAGNAILEHYLTELISRCSLIVGAYEPVGHAPCEHDEHRGILDSLEARDAERACACMNAHLRELEARIETSRMPAAKGLAQLLGIDSEQRTMVE